MINDATQAQIHAGFYTYPQEVPSILEPMVKRERMTDDDDKDRDVRRSLCAFC